MKLLLDTHILLWVEDQPRRISARLRRIFERPATELWLSPVSTSEIAMIVDSGQVRINRPLEQWFAAMSETFHLHEAPLTHEVVFASRAVTLPHADPADRLIAGTARYYGLRLVTADQRLLQGSGFSTLAA